MESIYKILYPLSPVNRVRDRPMEVLCLGLSRTGTDSLRKALGILGYGHVHHGLDVMENTAECVNWCHLFNAQANHQKITAEEFDTVLGQSEAVTDQPTCLFSSELIDAYPDAKVILNKRRDLAAWRISFTALGRDFFTWSLWARGLVDIEEFWVYRFIDLGMYRHFKSDFENQAIPGYYEHYQVLEDKLRSEDKQYLSWTFDDGWEPLCEFLGKPVPSEPFPSGNALPEIYEKMGRLRGKRARRGNRKLSIAGGIMVAGLAATVAVALKKR